MSKQTMFPLFQRFRLLCNPARSLRLAVAITALTVRAQAAVPTVVGGDGHYLALTETGALYSWGRNDFGQLGLGGRPVAAWGGPSAPVLVPPPPGATWRVVAAGDNHSLAIGSDGSLWAWGRNDLAQLSFRPSLVRRWRAGGARETSPVRISLDNDWTVISGGMLSSFALKRDGSLWACGGNWMGQLASGSAVFMEFTPPLERLPQLPGLNRIGHDSDWARVQAASEHVLAQKRDGTLWAWGRNDCGQLGNGTFASTNRPARLSPETNWTCFAAAGAGQRGAWSAAIKTDGTLWVWGNWKRLKISASTLGSNNTNLSASPRQLGTDTNWVQVACGHERGAAVKVDGTLWTWGDAPAALPSTNGLDLQQIGTDRDWRQVALDGAGFGNESSLLATKNDGTLWTWNPLFLPAQGFSVNAVSNGAPHALLQLRTASRPR